jgi:mRNA interferase MazF
VRGKYGSQIKIRDIGLGDVHHYPACYCDFNLHQNKNERSYSMSRKQIKRGDIYFANLNPTIGSEQGDMRPVLVVQNNAGNTHSPTIVVVPITRNKNKNALPTHVVLPQSSGLESDSLALVEQIRTIDRSRMYAYIGHISSTVQTEIDTALLVCVGIDEHCYSKGDVMTLTLCRRCESDFRSSGYVLVKKGWQEVKENCDFCKVRQGLTFGIFGMP